MKFVKVRIRRGDQASGEPQMVYPAMFNPYEVQSSGVGHLHQGYSGHIGFGGSEEWTIIGVDDAVADRYATDPDMAIVTATQADVEMESWRLFRGDPAEEIRDPVRIQAIVAKQAVGLALTAEDMAALDPTSPVRGINKRRPAAEILAQANAARGTK